MFNIKKTKNNHGQGMFAKRNITSGTTIHSEHPLFTFPLDASQAAVVHKILQLDPSVHKEFRSLHNPFPSRSEHEDVASMAETNSLPLAPPTTTGRNYAQASSGVFLQAARINHSCAPNAQYTWDDEKNELKIQATRNIKRHEEITITYLPSCPSYLLRQVYLKGTYNFDCDCELCEREQEHSSRPFNFKDTKRACSARIHGLSSKFAEIEDVEQRRAEVRGAYAMLRHVWHEMRRQGRPKEWLSQVCVMASEVAVADGDRARATVFLWRAALELEEGNGKPETKAVVDGDRDEEKRGLIVKFQETVNTFLNTLAADTTRVWRTEVGEVPYEAKGDEAECWLWEGDQPDGEAKWER